MTLVKERNFSQAFYSTLLTFPYAQLSLSIFTLFNITIQQFFQGRAITHHFNKKIEKGMH